MLKQLICQRNLPPLQSRAEMLEVLQHEEYGYLPPKPDQLTWKKEEDTIRRFFAGKATMNEAVLTARFGVKEFSFPIKYALPTAPGKHPFFIQINFRPDMPDRYQPTEELIDHGYGVFSFSYKDITSDDGDFTNGLAGVLFEDGKRSPTDPGKIAMWAWAAQRVLDFAESIPGLDHRRAIVCGHSRLGKTALLAAAADERFYAAHSNDSGCSGAALSRGKEGETVAKICQKFPFWFCGNYCRYAKKERTMPFDQHFLLACIAPRLVHVSSAAEDLWADPVSEFLNCYASGLMAEDRLPAPGDRFHAGRVGYDLRNGQHSFSREDWLNLIAFLKNH